MEYARRFKLLVCAPAFDESDLEGARLRQILTNLLSNAIKYTSPVFAGLQFEGMYALGGVAVATGGGGLALVACATGGHREGQGKSSGSGEDLAAAGGTDHVCRTSLRGWTRTRDEGSPPRPPWSYATKVGSDGDRKGRNR